MNWNILQIDERVGLHLNFLFWVAIVLPFVFAILLSIPVYLDSNLVFSWTAEGYKKFLELYSFPLSLLSLSVLFGVMIGRFHGSKQRGVAIIENENNNKLRNFYEHRKSFYEHMADFDWKNANERGVDFKHPKKLYKLFFPSNSPLSFSFICNEQDLFDRLKKVVDDILRDPRSPPDIEVIKALFDNFGCDVDEKAYCEHIDMYNKVDGDGINVELWLSARDMSSALGLIEDLIEFSLLFVDLNKELEDGDITHAFMDILYPRQSYNQNQEA